MMYDDALRLENQLCFRLYRLSRMFVRLYQPALESLDLTYPQYLVMLVLWQSHSIDYKELGSRLELQTGTLTPIIQKLETRGFVVRRKDRRDTRRTLVELTPAGVELKAKALALHDALDESDAFDREKYVEYARVLDDLAETLAGLEERTDRR